MSNTIRNADIRAKIKTARLRHYEISEVIGISEYTLSVWLRKVLSEERKQLILDAIEKLSKK